MLHLKSSTLEAYRNPGGWAEFWIGLVVFIFFGAFCGRIIYMENQVKKSDLEMKLKILQPDGDK